MATYTNRLGLKRPDGSDPFKRQDFVDNWNRLDAAPGVYPCTSTSRPTWSTAQAGRLIFETDTFSVYQWDGSTFTNVLDTPTAWAGGINIGATLSPNANANYNFITVSAPKPGYLFFVGSARAASTGTNIGGITFTPIVDSAPVSLVGQNYTQFILRDGTTYYDHREVPFFALAPVNAGTHTCGVRASTSGYPNPIVVSAARGLAMFSRTA
jgi:hypothetical protein